MLIKEQFNTILNTQLSTEGTSETKGGYVTLVGTSRKETNLNIDVSEDDCVESDDKSSKPVTPRLVQCNHCEEQFATKQSKFNHVKTIHEGVIFPCNQCNYKTNLKPNLTKHIQSVHNSTKFPCTHCNFQSANKYSLRYHIKTQHEGRRFNCPLL